MARNRVKVTVTVEVPGIDKRRVETLAGEVQATMLDACHVLDPVRLRLRQRQEAADAQAVEASIASLRKSVRLLARLTKYAA